MAAAPDPKWLEILKASGWQTAALTAASALTLYLNATKRFPVPLDSRVVQTAEVSVVVFGFLTIFSIGPHITKTSNIVASMLAHRLMVRGAQRQMAKDIPSMTSKKRELIGYLLANNQKMFTCTLDGGNANTLLSKGIVVCALLPGQSPTTFGVPFKVPDHVWDVLVQQMAEFLNTWKTGEHFPYSVPWMVR